MVSLQGAGAGVELDPAAGVSSSLTGLGAGLDATTSLSSAGSGADLTAMTSLTVEGSGVELLMMGPLPAESMNVFAADSTVVMNS